MVSTQHNITIYNGLDILFIINLDHFCTSDVYFRNLNKFHYKTSFIGYVSSMSKIIEIKQ